MSPKEKDIAQFNHILAMNSDIKRYLSLAPRVNPISLRLTAANAMENNGLPQEPQPKADS